MSLKNVSLILDELTNNSSTLAKEEIIKQHIDDYDFKRTVLYALNPFKVFNTTRVYYVENQNHNKLSNDKIFSMLDYLSKKSGATNDDIEALSRISSIDKQTVDVVHKIVNKHLNCGASTKLFRKYLPELPVFGVMLCNKNLKQLFKLINNDVTKMVWSYKMDGVRCIAPPNKYISRTGKLYNNFNCFNMGLSRLRDRTLELFPSLFKCEDDIIFDGEVIINNTAEKSGFNFQQLMTQIRRHNEIDPTYFEFCVFDLMTDKLTFEQRFKVLFEVFKSFDLNNKITNISLLTQYNCGQYDTPEKLTELSEKIVKQGYEGIVLKILNSPYEYDYSKYQHKLKPMKTLDCKVVGWEYGKNKYSNVIGALKCQLKDGTTFDVSGLTDQQRVDFMTDTPNIIEIEFQDYTKAGKPRIPTFVRVRDDKLTID